MPKELTHLIVAEASRQRFLSLNSESFLSEQLKLNRDYYRFGAVMHDIPFCASSSGKGTSLKEKGHLVHHGTLDHDTLGPFSRLGVWYDRTGRTDILALLAGSLTHMAADSVFHPFVYYYTGTDISRHYRLEALMDTHLHSRQDTWVDTPVATRQVYKKLRLQFWRLSGYLSGFFDLPDSFKTELIRALAMHAFSLRLFTNRPGFHLFRLTSVLGTEEYKRKIHLFYPPGMRFDTPFFETESSYRHPVTGRPGRDSLESLVEKAVDLSCGMFGALQEAAENTSVMDFVESLSPVSLETGLEPATGKQFRYTDLSTPVDRLVCGLKH